MNLHVRHNQDRRDCKSRGAFSLIEVVFALAIFSFSMVTIVGLLATGLTSADDSSRNLAVANVQRLVRANINATDFASIASTTSATTLYFTATGYPTKSGATGVDAPYYIVTYTVSAPLNSLVISPTSGKVVQVKISNPPPDTRSSTFSLFIAQ